jgi:hypothetical protein
MIFGSRRESGNMAAGSLYDAERSTGLALAEERGNRV